MQMNVLSAIYQALSLINFALQENHAPILNISEIVDDFLHSTHYTSLYNNLYLNWTTNNNFYYTVNFSGQYAEISDLALGAQLVRNISFIKYVSLFLCEKDQRELLRLAAKTEFQKLMDQIFSDVD